MKANGNEHRSQYDPCESRDSIQVAPAKASIAERRQSGDLFIYLKESVRLVENLRMMALVVMMVFIGFGLAVSSMPVITEVSAQGNMTGNATGNWTDTGGDSGNISSATLVP